MSATSRCLVMAIRQQRFEYEYHGLSKLSGCEGCDAKLDCSPWAQVSSGPVPATRKNEGNFFQTERMFCFQVIHWNKHARNTPATLPQHKENIPLGGSRLTEIALSESFFFIKHLHNVEISKGPCEARIGMDMLR